MTREEYEQLYENKEEISIPDEFVREWIERIAIAMNVVNDGSYELHYGKYDSKKDAYEYHIEPCSVLPFKEYHIYRGIDKLAEVCGEELLKEVDENKDRYSITRYFYYKGIRFFELRTIEDEDKQRAPQKPAKEAE